MKYLELTYPDAAQNLACDEALLEFFEKSGSGDELLRLWQPNKVFVVLGHGSQWRQEVDASACAADGIPVLRRCSGGGTVLQGAGCLNYSLILRQDNFAGAGVRAAFEFVLDRHRSCFEPLIGSPVSIKGISDLTLGERKFSGNAQYRKRQYVLVHGTFLLNFDLCSMGRFLKVPIKQPDYRRQRGHHDFLVNLEVEAEMIRGSLQTCWSARDSFDAMQLETIIPSLLRERYYRKEWNEKF